MTILEIIKEVSRLPQNHKRIDYKDNGTYCDIAVIEKKIYFYYTSFEEYNLITVEDIIEMVDLEINFTKQL